MTVQGPRTLVLRYPIRPFIECVQQKMSEFGENVIDANTGSVREKEISSSLKELDREDQGNIIALKSV